ncbi:hypothetical protein Btru_022078 [Bulinus truncatus]|nr:hypothetical protein Btru_022078 [Bulinus truncatus]
MNSSTMVNNSLIPIFPRTTTKPPSTTVGYYVCGSKASLLEQYFAYQNMECYVNPVFSYFGFIANVLCLSILKRSGLSKPSNILLFGLVNADIMCLMMTMNYALPIMYFGPDKLYPVSEISRLLLLFPVFSPYRLSRDPGSVMTYGTCDRCESLSDYSGLSLSQMRFYLARATWALPVDTTEPC